MQSYKSNYREGNPERRKRASGLLARYPDLGPAELQELIDFYNTSAAIDTALLTCDELIRPKIAVFQSEQRNLLRGGANLRMLIVVQFAIFAALIYAAIVMVN